MRRRAQIIFQIKEGCKASCEKLIAWFIVAKGRYNYTNFNKFEYGSEYGEFGAK